MKVSTATVRNIMAKLCQLGYLDQPHTSAGRVPQVAAYRYYVSYFLAGSRVSKALLDEIKRQKQELVDYYELTRFILAKLANATSNVALARLPGHVMISGWANFFACSDFGTIDHLARLVRLLEDKQRTENLLTSLGQPEGVRFLIGEESVCNELKDCTLAITSYPTRYGQGTLGLMGPVRMNYRKALGFLEKCAEALAQE